MQKEILIHYIQRESNKNDSWQFILISLLTPILKFKYIAMFRSQKLFSLSGIILLIVLLLNGVIIEAAYTDNQNLYWALLISIPLLAIAIYYAKQKKYVILPDNTIEDIRFGSGYVRFKPANHSMYKSTIDTNDLTVLIGNHQCAQPYNSGILSIGYCIENRNNGTTSQ